MYYRNKIDSLQNIFGTNDIELKEKALRVGRQEFPIRQDVIDLTQMGKPTPFAEDIQYTFGAEWQAHGHILPEHSAEFAQYFDLVDLSSLKDARVCDLGCGSGRWSYFLKDLCKELVLVDFSDAIYVARENLRETNRALFFKADITNLPFADNFTDFIVCLGVLHHLPVPCLDAVKSLKRFSPRMLIFLYYGLDNRPFYFRVILSGVTGVRQVLSRIRSTYFRKIFSILGTVFIYLPMVLLGKFLALFGLGRFVPLYEYYEDKSLKRIQQDVYDRFFTRIEQRVSRAQIMELHSDFANIRVSDRFPYWHFLCFRKFKV
jgi:ubiquinone/menaquinone biosynthesis C-methylase UbiE